jgi:WD40 repeat protein/serine/threonine protein kinase
MSDRQPPSFDPLPLKAQHRLDKLCDRFEAALKAGRRPVIERYVRHMPGSMRPTVLFELLALELEFRRQSGERPGQAEYCERFPENSEVVEAAFGSATEPTAIPSTDLLARWTLSRQVRQARDTLVGGASSDSSSSSFFALWPQHARVWTENQTLNLRKGILGSTDPKDSASPPSQLDHEPNLSLVAEETLVQGGGVPTLVVGDYELLEFVGKGGMGVVYRARHRRLHRTVAFKLIRPDRLKNLLPEKRREWLERFRTEAQAAARSEHANVVTVYDVAEVNGQPFYTMHYVDGSSLAEVCRDGPLTNHRAVTYLEPVARAVHHIHTCGVLHRDIKPKNILIDGQDQPLVSDFGLALWQESSDAAKPAEALLGTPAYMSPEQARYPDLVDATSDVYSLGATLYHLLTGRPPFQGPDHADTLRQVDEEEPVPPRQLNRSVDKDLETITLKCLQKDRSRRYADAAALAEDLRRYLNREPIQARPVGPMERLWLWARRKPAVATWSGLAGLFLVVALIVSTSFALYESKVSFDLGNALKESRESRSQLSNLTKESIQLSLGHALSLCEQGDVGRGLVRLAHSLDVATEVEATELQRVIRLNLAAWHPRLSPLRAVLPMSGDVDAVAFSPDGKIIVTAGKSTSAQLWDAASGEPIGKPLAHPGLVHAVAFHPGGKILITGSGDFSQKKSGLARLWDVDTGQPLGSPLAHSATVNAVAVSPDGKLVLTGTADKTVYLWDLATREHRAVQCSTPIRAVAFHPKGGKFLVACGSSAQLWDLARLQEIGQLTHSQPVLAVAFSPDGKFMVTGSRDTTLRLWDTDTCEVINQLSPRQGEVGALAFSSDGTILVTGGTDKTARLWRTANWQPIGAPIPHPGRVQAVAIHRDRVLTGGDDKTARLWGIAACQSDKTSWQHEGPVSAVAVSPDGQTAVTGSWDKSVRLWDTVTHEPIGKPLPHGDQVLTVAFSPDSQILAAGCWDGTASLWSAKSGRQLHQLKQHRRTVLAIAFSPDGTKVLTGSADKTAQQWVVGTGEPVGQALQHDEVIQAIAFSPDGTTILTGSYDRTARLWETGTGRLIREFRGHVDAIRSVAFSPDGQHILTASWDHTGRVWSTATGLAVGSPLCHQDGVRSASFSPDGKWILTASKDGTARLWEAATLKPLRTFFQHQEEVLTAAFSSDSKLALTSGKDRTARLWDVDTGEAIGPTLQHQNAVWAATFGRDGKIILTGSHDNTARLWQTPAILEGDVQRILLWIEVITGMEFERGGTVRMLNADTWRQCRQQLEHLGGPLLP